MVTERLALSEREQRLVEKPKGVEVQPLQELYWALIIHLLLYSS
ncbi:hypothetical protein [Nostoc sp. 'Peltigera malacea cyanobiont' DB3992]|nr:hypothetical protein [Nostoc sp. 'Peltigera malacea cyanobiont' DB3992]